MTAQISPRIIPPRRLALCGGGVRCVAHVGVFKALAEAGILTCVKEVVGISAGALFGLFFVLGYSLEQIERLALEFDFNQLRQIDAESVMAFPFTFGLDAGVGIEKFIKIVLARKGLDPEISFASLFTHLSKIIQNAPRLRCFATDIQTACVKEFSAEATPTCPVWIGLRASMSLPILYTPVKDPLTGHILMDGGVLHNLPLVFQPLEEVDTTLAVLFQTNPVPVETPELIHVFQYVYDAITKMRNTPYLEKFKGQIILIDSDDFTGLSFGESKDSRATLIQKAYQQTKAFLFTQGKKPLRRYSVA
jgi:NTE family protein